MTHEVIEMGDLFDFEVQTGPDRIDSGGVKDKKKIPLACNNVLYLSNGLTLSLSVKLMIVLVLQLISKCTVN